jgi:hypothetical protein
MRLSDKIGLWADDKLSEMYFERVRFRTLREWALNLLIPVCNHKDFETGTECKNRGEPCLLPNWDDSPEESIEWYCYEHMHSAGYCRGCRLFWAGCEDFDFDPHGLCSNCRHNPDVTGEDDWEDEYDSTDGYYDEQLP